MVYLELRTTPRAMPSASLTKAQYVQTILDAIAAFEAESPRHPLRTRLILSIDRRNSLVEALEVVDLAREFQASGVVGVDLCGDPAKSGIEALAPAFGQVCAIPGMGLTLHFAEAACSGTDEELRMLLAWKPGSASAMLST